MSHQIYTITKFEVVAPYTLRLTFDDGAEKTIDLLPVLRGELFSPLRDLNFFNQVRLDPETRTVVWPNEADFDPATLHDWDEVGPEMIEMASKWEIKIPDVEAVVFEKVLEDARRLSFREKISLVRILLQEIETHAEELELFEPFATRKIYLPSKEPVTANALREELENYETGMQDPDQK